MRVSAANTTSLVSDPVSAEVTPLRNLWLQLGRSEGSEALTALQRWLEELERSPQYVQGIAALKHTAAQVEAHIQTQLRAHLDALSALRHQLGEHSQAHPSLSDAPLGSDAPLAALDEPFTFRHFDRRIRAKVDLDDPWLPGKKARWPTLIDELHAVIETKLLRARSHAEANATLSRAIHAVQAQLLQEKTTLKQQWVLFRDKTRSEASFAWRRLQWVVEVALPQADLSTADPDAMAHAFLLESIHALRADRNPRWEYCPTTVSVLREIKESASLVHQTLTQRRSVAVALRPLLQRYVLRSQWYDRTALQTIIRRNKGSAVVDRLLCQNIGRFLLDNGVVAITPEVRRPISSIGPEPMPGPLVYAVATHYKTLKRTQLREWVQHHWQQAQRLQTQGLALRALLFVLFRGRGGVIYQLPPELHRRELIVHFATVDLGQKPPNAQDRTEKTEYIDPDGLLPATL